MKNILPFWFSEIQDIWSRVLARVRDRLSTAAALSGRFCIIHIHITVFLFPFWLFKRASMWYRPLLFPLCFHSRTFQSIAEKCCTYCLWRTISLHFICLLSKGSIGTLRGYCSSGLFLDICILGCFRSFTDLPSSDKLFLCKCMISE